MGQFGGLRFRHNKGTACNVLFADGSVRSIGWAPKRAGRAGPGYYSLEFIRKWLMIKWPVGVTPAY